MDAGGAVSARRLRGHRVVAQDVARSRTRAALILAVSAACGTRQGLVRVGAMTTTTQTPSITTSRQSSLPFGALAYIGAGGSILACYGKTILLATAGELGLGLGRLALNPHAQAVLMWALGMLAVYGLAQDRKTHGHIFPLAIGTVGVVVIMVTLYTYYSTAIEMTGYVLLVAAALWNQNVMLRELNREVRALKNSLELRVEEQVTEIERLARLKRFLAPDVANLITAEDEKSVLQSHRSRIAALFCDIRGFTTFSESMEPEEVMNVLQTYHQQVGRLVAEYGGTIDHRAGDGLMVFFNDPLPCEEPVLRAVELGLAIREAFAELNADWDKRRYGLGIGIGIASGYATLGIVGFEGRFDYTANGNPVNLAARLCDQARDGQILISQKALVEIEDRAQVEAVGELELRGFAKPAPVYDVRGLIADTPDRG